MSIGNRHIVVRESELIYNGDEGTDPGIKTIPGKDFKSLIHFILDNSDSSDIALSYFRKKSREVIRFHNFVGVIETKNGFTIEVLPKIDYPEDTLEQRRIFLSMLRHLKNSPFRSISEAHLKTRKFPVFEIFITAFLSEMNELIRKGVKRAYREKEENLNCAKGRIHFPGQITNNIVHKEKFYVHYDEFSLDIPQNRILKSTLRYLLQRSRLYQNKIRLKQYLQMWDPIPHSGNIEDDLQHTNGLSRLYTHYEKPIQWARVFLKGESFTNFRGYSVNTALLFPMERIFEDYVAAMFRRYLKDDNLTLRIQHRQKYLVDQHKDKPKFQLIPDIVIERDSQPIAILDTKWKAIDQNAPKENYGISQADMYQLFAYGSKYEGNPKLFLIYPENENFQEQLYSFNYSKDALELQVVPFRLNRERVDVKKFVKEIKGKF
jgi:5-methylcytosine-specific restriction enzyme subunit McrC